MPIEEFRIENVDGLDLVECKGIPQLMVITGPNGVGKSTLLNTLYQDTQKHRRSHPNNTNIKFGSGGRCVYFSPNRVPQSNNILRSQLINSDSNQFSEMLSDENLDLPGIGKREDILQSADTRPYQAVRRRLAELRELRREVLDNAYSPKTGVDADVAPEPTEQLREAISDVLPAIDFKGFEATSENARQNRPIIQLIFENRSGDRVDFLDLSSGEKDVVAMLFLLVEPEIQQQYIEAGIDEHVDEELTVLIDSPEMHLHPDLEKRLLKHIQDYIKKSSGAESNVKFIIATHSKVMMEEVDKENLYYLLYPSMVNGNQLESAADIDTESLQKITNELGLSALSSGRHLLCVEGKTDKEIISRLYPEVLDDFTLVTMGGSEQVQNIDSALSSIVDELSSTGREIFAIIDRDRNPDVDSDVLDRIHVLSSTCIENLMISPEAIYSLTERMLDSEKQSDMGIESVEDVESQIQRIISEPSFKKEEVWTRFNEEFNPININRREYYHKEEKNIVKDFDEYVDSKVEDHRKSVDDIDEIESNVSTIIANEEWDQLDGKRILKELSNEYNIEHRRFARLIAQRMYDMSESDSESFERPHEMTNFLQEIKSSVTSTK